MIPLRLMMCPPHWQLLRDAVEARGLGLLVATTAVQAQAKISSGHPDPLMVAYLAIVRQALESVPEVQTKPSGKVECPLCLVIERCPCGAPDCRARLEKWVDFAADEAKEKFAQLPS